jgi:hypothetical protein
VSPLPGARTRVVVATDALLAHSARLDTLWAALRADSVTLAQLTGVRPDLLEGAPAAAVRSVPEVVAAHTLTAAAAAEAESAVRALRMAIARYSDAEQEQRQRTLLLGQQLGILLGPILRDLLLVCLPAVVVAGVVGAPSAAQVAALKQWMLEHPEIITNPGFVEAVRAAVMGMDDAVGSALGLPPGVAGGIAALGGFVGAQAGAPYLLGAGAPFGLFRDGPVHIDRVSTTTAATGPAGSVGRLARVPEGDQVRIERYDAPGEASRYVVYVGPTETFSPVADHEPWDLTSAVTGVAGLDAGSLRATDQAMREAGIGAGDEVQVVGFSQGGLVAARIAASGDWNVVGLETYGAPTGNVDLPSGLHGMAVRNSDDFVPALAGPQLDHHLVQIERRAFEPDSPIPTDLPAPAHQRSAYVATATEIDRARSPVVREQIAAMDAFTAEYTQRPGSSITVMTYHAERGLGRAIASSGGSIP